MGVRESHETRGRIIWEEKNTRHQIIEEFLRAYEAARRANRVFIDTYVYGADNSPPSIPACITSLGLSWPCTVHDVKQAFRSKVKTMHPDNGGSSEEFQVLYGAYQEALRLITT